MSNPTPTSADVALTRMSRVRSSNPAYTLALVEDLKLVTAEYWAMKEEHRAMRKALEEYEAIKSESAGVAGWHKNGDIAEWEEFEFTSVLSTIPQR